MIELAFPIAAVVFIYLIAVPIVTIVSAGILRLWRREVRHPHEMGSDAVWLFLVAPVLVPTIWLLIAVAHELDGHHGVVSCLAAHDVGTLCLDLVLAAVLIVAPFKIRGIRQWWRERSTPAGDLRPDEIDGVSFHRGTDVPGLACTRGLFRPRIEVDERLLTTLAPGQLRSVLFHELAHARSFDPLRKWVARVCLSLNPLAGLLRADLARWELGREILCDLRAVERGADRFDLAGALVQVARECPSPRHGCCGILGVERLEVRVRLLCEEEIPTPRFEYVPIMVAGLLALLMEPHRGGQGFLEWLHHGAESSWLMFVGG